MDLFGSGGIEQGALVNTVMNPPRVINVCMCMYVYVCTCVCAQSMLLHSSSGEARTAQ